MFSSSFSSVCFTDVQTVTEPADSTPTANTPDGTNSANPGDLSNTTYDLNNTTNSPRKHSF